MLKRLNDHLRSLAELRQRHFPNSVAPALIVDPRPQGFITPSGGGSFSWEPPSNVHAPENRDELAFYSVGQLTALLRARKISSEELTQFCLDRLKKYRP